MGIIFVVVVLWFWFVVCTCRFFFFLCVDFYFSFSFWSRLLSHVVLLSRIFLTSFSSFPHIVPLGMRESSLIFVISSLSISWYLVLQRGVLSSGISICAFSFMRFKFGFDFFLFFCVLWCYFLLEFSRDEDFVL